MKLKYAIAGIFMGAVANQADAQSLSSVVSACGDARTMDQQQRCANATIRAVEAFGRQAQREARQVRAIRSEQQIANTCEINPVQSHSSVRMFRSSVFNAMRQSQQCMGVVANFAESYRTGINVMAFNSLANHVGKMRRIFSHSPGFF